MKAFMSIMKIVGVIVSGLAGGAAVFMALPEYVPGTIRWPAALFVSTFISTGYAVNEMKLRPKISRRMVLRASTVIGAAIVCFAGLSRYEDLDRIKNVDLKNYEAIGETTLENARSHVLKSQRESAMQFRAAALESVESNPAKFFLWLSQVTGLSVLLLMVLLAAGVGLSIDVANTAVFDHGKPEQRTFAESILPHLKSAFGWVGRGISTIFEWAAKWAAKLGQLIESLFELCIASIMALVDKLRKGKVDKRPRQPENVNHRQPNRPAAFSVNVDKDKQVDMTNPVNQLIHQLLVDTRLSYRDIVKRVRKETGQSRSPQHVGDVNKATGARK